MSKLVAEFLKSRLNDQRQKGLQRQLKAEQSSLVDFASNDYLGLARSTTLFNEIHSTTQKFDARNGSTGSRLLTGNSAFAEETEAFLADFFQGESSLVLNSGYAANLSVLSALPQKGDTVLYDELSHASLKDGARLSLAKRFSFRHNDIEDLRSKIKRSSGRIFIVMESIYSMDGDEGRLRNICDVADDVDACVILDEAHSTGVEESNGRGLAIRDKLHNRVPVRIYTFGKAMGVHGACIVGSKTLREYLINFARPFIYTTALSPHNFAAIRCSVDFMVRHPELQLQLRKNIKTFLRETESIPNKSKSSGAIQTIVIPGNENVRMAAELLVKKGFDVRPILSPTVALGAERLRICLHAFNTDDQVKDLCRVLHETLTMTQAV